MGAYYIVTDLGIRADFEFIEPESELTRLGLVGLMTSFEGVWTANYSSGPCVYNPVDAILHLIKIVEKLSSEAQSEWDRCLSRRFDMGFESFDDRFHSEWDVPPEVLQRIVKVNGSLAITIYRGDKLKETEK